MVQQLTATEISWANFLRKSKEYEQAVELYQPILEKLDARETEPDQFTRLVLFGLGESYVHLDRSAEALTCWTRLCENLSDPNWNAFEQQRAICLTRTGKIAEGVNAADTLLLDANVTAVMYYDAACCNAVAAEMLASGKTVAGANRDAEWYQERALSHLESAAEEGFLTMRICESMRRRMSI